MGLGDMLQAKRDAEDAARYRFLRDSAGNAIMKRLMAEVRSNEWDKLVDAEVARFARIAKGKKESQ